MSEAASPTPSVWRGVRVRRAIAVSAQLLLVVVSNLIAFGLRFDGSVPSWAWLSFWETLPWLVAVRAFTFVPFRLYEGVWRYTGIYDLRALVLAVATSTAIFVVGTRAAGLSAYPRSVFVIDAILLTLLLGGMRVSSRVYREFTNRGGGKRVLLYGAGDAAELIVRDMATDSRQLYQPVGFIDDDPAKAKARIHGVPVLGTRDDLAAVLERVQPDEILIAVPDVEPAIARSLVRLIQPYKIPIKTLPHLRDIVDGKVTVQQIRSLSLDDLLARAPVGIDPAPLRALITGRRLMVTGAGGSIGSELCRQIAQYAPAALVMFERYENSLHAVRLELEDLGSSVPVTAVIGDVTDEVRVNEVLATFRPHVIFHAAAHKHVPLMEEHPCEAIKNNVGGTRTLVEAAERHGVERFLFISTDKAVNPTNVMGASKRLSELVVQSKALRGTTSFAAVRFGNVLGSNGSVVPRFLSQIRRGGPLTLTHPEMRRFFMTIPEAVQLVLHATSQADSGATYVLEMGEAVKLVDMARDLIRLSGLVPDEDIQIEFIGLRPGEKLYEELVGPGERAYPSAIDKVRRLESTVRVAPDLIARVRELEELARRGQADAVVAALRALVPNFEPVVESVGAAAAPSRPDTRTAVTVAPAAVSFALDAPAISRSVSVDASIGARRLPGYSSSSLK